MNINFEKIEEEVIPHFCGGEKEVYMKKYADGNNKIVKIRLLPGATIGMHTHEINSETIYVLKGQGRVLYDDASEDLSEGSCHYCPQGHAHSLINNSDDELIVFAVIPKHAE